MSFALSLALALALCPVVLPGAATAAPPREGMPTILPPKTAHLRLDATMASTLEATDQHFVVWAEGDLDVERNAAQLAIAIPDMATIEMIQVDGRLYVRELPGGQWVEDASDGAAAMPLNPGDSLGMAPEGLEFQRVGPERINDAPTTHWHADVDYAKLLGLEPEGLGEEPFQLVFTMDLWVGDDDGYLHRFAMDMAMSATDEGTGQAASFTASLIMTFSNFDAPVAIAAPADAVPAENALAGPQARLPVLSGGLASLQGAIGRTPNAASFALAPAAGVATASPTPRSAPKPTPQPTKTVAAVAAAATAQPTAQPVNVAAAVDPAPAPAPAPAPVSGGRGGSPANLVLAGLMGLALVGALGMFVLATRRS